MRTTLDVDEDLILAAKQIAQQRGTTMGRVVSQLLRKAMEPNQSATLRNGVPLFSPRQNTAKPTLELINRLRDEA